MAEVGKKKRRIALIVLCVVIVLAGAAAGVLVWENHVGRQFPMWRTPCLEPDAKDIDPNVSLRFSGINFDVPNTSDELRDVILMKVTATPGREIYGAPLSWIDYWYKGKWHTVWCKEYSTAAMTEGYGAPKTADEEIPIIESVSPAGLFVLDGQYRLFMQGLGYCDIDITGIERQFPMWYTPCREPEEDDITPDLFLYSAGIDHGYTLASGGLYDKVMLKWQGPAGRGVSGSNALWADYWYEGEWHTVWCSGGESMAVSVSYDPPETDHEQMSLTEFVPAGLFVRDGKYRLFKSGFGYFEIRIAHDKYKNVKQ